MRARVYVQKQEYEWKAHFMASIPIVPGLTLKQITPKRVLSTEFTLEMVEIILSQKSIIKDNVQYELINSYVSFDDGVPYRNVELLEKTVQTDYSLSKDEAKIVNKILQEQYEKVSNIKRSKQEQLEFLEKKHATAEQQWELWEEEYVTTKNQNTELVKIVIVLSLLLFAGVLFFLQGMI